MRIIWEVTRHYFGITSSDRQNSHFSGDPRTNLENNAASKLGKASLNFWGVTLSLEVIGMRPDTAKSLICRESVRMTPVLF